MSRTTSTEVKAFLAGNYNSQSNPTVDPFIEMAGVMVDNLVTCATSKGVTLSDDTLKQIEKLLACHLYGFQDQFYKRKRTGQASGEFQGDTGMGLKSSFYGQTALSLDSSGCLSQADMPVIDLTMDWLGTPLRDQQTYDQRNGTNENFQ